MANGPKKNVDYVMKNQRVATIAKNRLEELRITLTEFHGHDLVDIRVFALPYAGRGKDMVATKKGLDLNVLRYEGPLGPRNTVTQRRNAPLEAIKWIEVSKIFVALPMQAVD